MHNLKSYGGGGGGDPPLIPSTFDGEDWLAVCPGERPADILWKEEQLGPRDSLDISEERKTPKHAGNRTTSTLSSL
jgi:hypothetical protein